MIPIPPAMSRTLWRVRRAPVRTPYGPSMKTRVPIGIPRSAVDQSPSSLIVIRSQAPFGRRRDRERVRPPPAVAGQEPPHEVLAGADRQLVEVASGHVDREDAGRLVDDGRHAQPVAHGLPDRLADPEDEHERGGRHVQRDPVADRDRVVDEVGADEQLVEEPEGDREIGVQVEAVPRLVRQPAPGGPDRADRHQREQAAADQRHQHVRVGRDQRQELADDVAAVAERVADGR